MIENTRQNLIRFSGREDIYCKHVHDILIPVNGLNITFEGEAADIGSGAGFPGIVLGICFPTLRMTLYESEKKKADFLLSVIQRLSLANCRVIADRVESAGRPESYDYVFARAVSSLPVLLEYAAPLLRISGKTYFFKGPKYREELQKSKNAQKSFFWGEPLIIPYSFDYGEETYHHYLLVYEKQKTTPRGFPRKPGMAVKTPL
jgi:16S rRNA (guanine527-N7)-methyltransferase